MIANKDLGNSKFVAINRFQNALILGWIFGIQLGSYF